MTMQANAMSASAAGFIPPGGLVRPGPIGRIVRLLLGAASAWAIWDNLVQPGPQAWLTSHLGPVQLNVGTLIVVGIGLWVFDEVINIGWGRHWGNIPQLSVIGVVGIGALVGLVLTGSVWSPLLGAIVYAWLFYTFAHLGLSFVLAAGLGTPGCEMRSIPQLLAKLSGREYREHVCPSPIHSLDVWEAGLRR